MRKHQPDLKAGSAGITNQAFLPPGQCGVLRHPGVNPTTSTITRDFDVDNDLLYANEDFLERSQKWQPVVPMLIRT